VKQGIFINTSRLASDDELDRLRDALTQAERGLRKAG